MNAPIRPPRSFAELIDLWGSMAVFASETNQPYERVKQWRARNNIPPRRWPPVKAAAWQRGWYFIDDALLARLAAEEAAA